jgi:hypothetical protein
MAPPLRLVTDLNESSGRVPELCEGMPEARGRAHQSTDKRALELMAAAWERSPPGVKPVSKAPRTQGKAAVLGAWGAEGHRAARPIRNASIR